MGTVPDFLFLFSCIFLYNDLYDDNDGVRPLSVCFSPVPYLLVLSPLVVLLFSSSIRRSFEIVAVSPFHFFPGILCADP
jgi:hypothetical protein